MVKIDGILEPPFCSTLRSTSPTRQDRLFPDRADGRSLPFSLFAAIRNTEILEKAAFANIILAAFPILLPGANGLRDNAKFHAGNAPNAEWKIALAIVLFPLTTIPAGGGNNENRI